MYCYYTGVTGVLVMSLSMFTSMNVISGFGAEFPYLFTAGHVIFCLSY